MNLPKAPLGELATEIVSGVACGKANAVADGVLHLRPFSVTPGGSLSTFDAPRIPANVIPNGRLGFQIGDILFNNTNSVELVGKSVVFSSPLDASFSNHMTRVRIDVDKANPRFVQAFLRHLYSQRFFEGRATRWVGQAAFGTAQLKSIEVPLPPLDEQRRIVAVLDRAAEIRRRADAARAKARAIVPALFLDMFGDPADNPKRWPIKPLGEEISLRGGGTPSKARPDFWAGSIPWVSAKDMKPQVISDSEDKITDEALANSATQMIPPNSVLVVVRGMILAHTVPIRMNSVAVTINQDLKALLPTVRLNADFLRWMLQVSHDYLLGKVRESAHGTKKLETEVLTSFPSMLPPPSLQSAFAEQVRRIEATARALDAAAAKAEAMAAALSAKAFG